ncbi:MAG TPA: c-type cytochrome [Anaerolineales bacterium]|nr:c-type cytochrome [Anaerolineales bacterium]
MSKEQDRVFFRNFTLILLALALFGVFAAYMGRYFAAMVPLGGVKTETVAERVAPVGEVYTEDNPPPASAGVTSTAATKEAAAEGAPVGGDKGKQTYDSVCMACHAVGVAGAPKVGDSAAWAPRIAQGAELLYERAIKGFQGQSGVMPAKGGRADLLDEDVKAAVDYMVASSGGPAAPVVEATPAVSPDASAEPAPAAVAPTTEAAAVPATAAANDKGKQVYDGACFACHASGVTGAPKLGDKEAWAPRIAQGNELLYEHALKGFMGKGLMPPKGGRADLPDEDVIAAVDYMVNAAK